MIESRNKNRVIAIMLVLIMIMTVSISVVLSIDYAYAKKSDTSQNKQIEITKGKDSEDITSGKETDVDKQIKAISELSEHFTLDTVDANKLLNFTLISGNMLADSLFSIEKTFAFIAIFVNGLANGNSWLNGIAQLIYAVTGDLGKSIFGDGSTLPEILIYAIIIALATASLMIARGRASDGLARFGKFFLVFIVALFLASNSVDVYNEINKVIYKVSNSVISSDGEESQPETIWNTTVVIPWSILEFDSAGSTTSESGNTFKTSDFKGFDEVKDMKVEKGIAADLNQKIDEKDYRAAMGYLGEKDYNKDIRAIFLLAPPVTVEPSEIEGGMSDEEAEKYFDKDDKGKVKTRNTTGKDTAETQYSVDGNWMSKKDAIQKVKDKHSSGSAKTLTELRYNIIQNGAENGIHTFTKSKISGAFLFMIMTCFISIIIAILSFLTFIVKIVAALLFFLWPFILIVAAYKQSGIDIMMRWVATFFGFQLGAIGLQLATSIMLRIVSNAMLANGGTYMSALFGMFVTISMALAIIFGWRPILSIISPKAASTVGRGIGELKRNHRMAQIAGGAMANAGSGIGKTLRGKGDSDNIEPGEEKKGWFNKLFKNNEAEDETKKETIGEDGKQDTEGIAKKPDENQIEGQGEGEEESNTGNDNELGDVATDSANPEQIGQFNNQNGEEDESEGEDDGGNEGVSDGIASKADKTENIIVPDNDTSEVGSSDGDSGVAPLGEVPDKKPSFKERITSAKNAVSDQVVGTSAYIGSKAAEKTKRNVKKGWETIESSADKVCEAPGAIRAKAKAKITESNFGKKVISMNDERAKHVQRVSTNRRNREIGRTVSREMESHIGYGSGEPTNRQTQIIAARQEPKTRQFEQRTRRNTDK